MITFSNVWNHLRILQAPNGVYVSKYHPGGVDTVEIAGPDGRRYPVKTPRLSDWALACEGGRVVVYYTRLNDDGTHELVVAPSTAECGAAHIDPTDGQGGNMDQIAFQGKTFRVRVQNGEVWLETSFDAGLTWNTGTSLGGADVIPGSPRLAGIDDRLFVLVEVQKPTGKQFYGTSLQHEQFNNGQAGATVWVRLA